MTVTMNIAIDTLLNTESIVTKSVSPFVNMNLLANRHTGKIVKIANGETAVNNGASKDGTAMKNGVKKEINQTHRDPSTYPLQLSAYLATYSTTKHVD